MSDYDNTNSGALFKNDKDGGNPNWPDYKGKINVDGTDYWLSAWIKDGKNGKFMSLSVKPKEVTGTTPRAAAKRDEPTDDIPF